MTNLTPIYTPPTPRQLQVLREIAKPRHRPATFKQIAAALGISTRQGFTSIVTALTRRGLVERDLYIPRSLRVTPAGVIRLRIEGGSP